MNRKVSVSVALAVSILVMSVTIAVTWIVSMHMFDSYMASIRKRQAQFEKIAEMDIYVRERFFGEIDDAYLFDRTAQGYMLGLGDKHSVYFTEKEFTELQQIEAGELVGIGVEITKDPTNYFRIARVYSGSPAEKAGIVKGGLIISVNGIDTKTITSLKSMHSLLRGSPGETIKLTCLYGATDEQEFSFQRDNFQAPTVEAPKIVDEIAYIRISSFGPNTAADFDYIMQDALNANPKALVFDLRDNTGGTYKSAYDMIDLLCPTGTIAKSQSRSGTLKVLATSGESFVDLPMVVLVNENTAAAAELFAVSVRDMAGGKVVGVKTAGHGTLQSSPKRLADGSAVSVTEALLLTGRDETYDVTGVEPDVEAQVNPGEELNLFDPDVSTDIQIARAMEVARLMAGVSTPQSQPPAEVPASDPESLPEQTSSVEGTEPEEAESAATESESAASSAASN